MSTTISQTPILLTGNGPFVLSGDMFATSLTAALVLNNGVGIGNILVTLPSTSTISDVMTNTGAVFGAWVKLKLINLNTSQTVLLVAADGATTISQNGTQALSTETYTVYELAPNIQVVQDLRLPSFASEYLTVVVQTDTLLPPTLNFAIPFTLIQDQGPTSSAISYNVSANYLQISPGVTALINVNVPLANGQMQSVVEAALAPAFQSQSTPLVGAIAGSSLTCQPFQARTGAFAVVYTNNTTAPTLWQVYFSGYQSTPNILAAFSPQLTVTQIFYN